MTGTDGNRARRLLCALFLLAVGVAGTFRLFPTTRLALLRRETVPLPDPGAEPVQEYLAGAAPFTEWRLFKEFRLTPRAHFDVSARVLSTERYRAGDSGELIPWDFAVAWGPAANEDSIRRVSISQYARFYVWSTSDPGLDRAAFARHSANMHLIPASTRVERALGGARRGDIVRLEGDLVDVQLPDGSSWNTSLTREDTGAGACETVYVSTLTIGRWRYR